ncbi:molybdopterin-binding protein [Thiomicrorhabdus sp.]|uniref:TOBE domain-containing protein n=1 Tax=Thiomicrorhabdus sp. TaxID=2039724 RepID=UPI002AA7CD5E|nr:molybdopterin-binding protein [Thiomicrorhabdus sp.]
MKFSARNQIKGIVKSIHEGVVNTEVVIEVAPGVEIASIITKSSADNLGLTVGKETYAFIKASSVMLAVE